MFSCGPIKWLSDSGLFVRIGFDTIALDPLHRYAIAFALSHKFGEPKISYPAAGSYLTSLSTTLLLNRQS